MKPGSHALSHTHIQQPRSNICHPGHCLNRCHIENWYPVSSWCNFLQSQGWSLDSILALRNPQVTKKWFHLPSSFSFPIHHVLEQFPKGETNVRVFKSAKRLPSNHPVWIPPAFQVIPDNRKKIFGTQWGFWNIFYCLKTLTISSFR